MDLGWVAVRTRALLAASHAVGRVGNCRAGIAGRAGQVMVKVYGVAMTMPQG